MRLKRETRVGVAALLSFVVLVAALVVKKGWVGKPAPLARIANPSEKNEATDETKAKESKTALAKNEPKASKQVGPVKLATDPQSTESPPSPSVVAEPAAPTMVASQVPAPGPGPTEGGPAPKPIEPGGPVDPIALPGDPTPPPGEVQIPAASNTPPPADKAPDVPPVASMIGDTLPPAQAPIPDVPIIAAEPTPAPTPKVAEPPKPSPTLVAEPSAPVPTEKAPSLDPVPTHSPPSGAMASAPETGAALGAGWVVIKSGGRRVPGAVAPAEPEVAIDGPRAPEESAADQIEPVLHRVQAGENFWTISQTYYRSPRYYKALHAANQRQVPRIDELYVGTVLRIPPPESLDRALILPVAARSKVADEPTGSKITRTSRRADPLEDVDLAVPSGRPKPRPEPEPEAPDEPRRPSYIVKPHETLRSIARDTLNDSRRDREILNLNRDVIDDPSALTAGTTLTLPRDAIIGRKSR